MNKRGNKVNGEPEFWAKVLKRDSGHWIWTGGKVGCVPGTCFNGERMPARRIAWLLVRGELIEDRPFLVMCGEPLCVNPKHYRPTLGECDIPAIFAADKRGDTHAIIASRYGVTRETITRFISKVKAQEAERARANRQRRDFYRDVVRNDDERLEAHRERSRKAMAAKRAKNIAMGLTSKGTPRKYKLKRYET